MDIFLKTLIALMMGLVAPGASAGGVDILIQDPWVRAAPPNVKVLAAYFEIKNNSKKPQILTGVSSPAFDQVGIHRTVMHENMAHMEHLKELSIPPQSSVTLMPGGLHLMLMDAKRPLQVGDQIPITLTFQNGKTVTFNAVVRSGQTGDTEGHQHMNHTMHETHKP